MPDRIVEPKSRTRLPVQLKPLASQGHTNTDREVWSKYQQPHMHSYSINQLTYAGVQFMAAGAGDLDFLGMPDDATRPTWLSEVKCVGTESSLFLCVNGWYSWSTLAWFGAPSIVDNRVNLVCSSEDPPLPLSLRLTGSTLPYLGRLEVRTYVGTYN